MTKLNGSEKQVRWAEEIKAKRLEEVRNWVSEVAKAEGAGDAEAAAFLAKVEEVLAGQTEAGWWIDTRNIQDIGIFVDKADHDAMMGIGRDKALRYRPLSV